MVDFEPVDTSDNSFFGRLLNIGGGSRQLGVEGDGAIGSALIGITKKEVLTQDSFTDNDNRDLSDNRNYQPTDIDIRNFSSSPVYVLNSAGANVTGSATRQEANPTVSPTIRTKKTQSTDQATAQTQKRGGDGINTNMLIIGGAILGGLYLFTDSKQSTEKAASGVAKAAIKRTKNEW